MRPPASRACSTNPAAGASPLFPPRYEEPEEAKEAILATVRRDPRQFGIEGTRWTLAAIHQVCDWLRTATPAGLSALLDRLGISWRRGRAYLHSPDPDYAAKVAYADELVARARASGGRIVVLYQDEFTFYRQPTVAQAWEERGRMQPLARYSYRTNTPTRLVGLLDVVDGRVLYKRRKRISLDALLSLYRQARLSYPDAQRIYVLLDNWPVHFHPDVLVGLEKQDLRWPLHLPGNWPTQPSEKFQRKYGGWQLPVQLVALPTYAPWTNPIEKLWRKLSQEVLHLHRLADDLDGLRQRVNCFLDEYANGSPELLRYVGLLVPN